MGLVPAGAYRNRNYFGAKVSAEAVEESRRDMAFDPQTSGGLLISAPPESAAVIMNLKQLEAFVSVADTRSFSKTAKELYLTQPTISAHISSLEAELNTRLFIRNTKEVRLSERGKCLYQYARQMLDLEEEISREFGTGEEPGADRVAIAASTIPSQYILPELLAEFKKENPLEKFELFEGDSASVIERIQNGQAQIGFAGTAADDPGCRNIPFYKDRLVVMKDCG